MEGDFIKINKWLLPFSWLYGAGVKLRNLLFNVRVLKSRDFDIPVISVGNITVGGTGKTPHVEYLINLLRSKFHVAVLSRGYKRKSRGFILANEQTTMPQIGDEPYQMKQKFPDVVVAVDKNRCHGIDLLTDTEVGGKELDVILLDDAFQYRYVQPGINILLVDYHRLVIYDRLLPAGRLREPVKGKDRADIVIVTKCPKELKPMDYRVIMKAMNLYPYQNLYFTTLEYDAMHPVFPTTQASVAPRHLADIQADDHILLLTGIASPEQMMHDIAPFSNHLTPLTFPDHHQFKQKDIDLINETFEAMPTPKYIITTEKDATRLQIAEGLSDNVRNNIQALPVRITFMLDQEDKFNNNIIGYVRKNSRHSILAKAKDDHKSKDGHHTGNRPRTISFKNN